MPGVGKSVIGKELALKLGFTFLDADTIIERNAGSKLQQIIDSCGESVFLEMEQAAILELGSIDKHVICPGGSVVYSDSAMTFLRQHSMIILLEASLAEIRGRIGNPETRGIVGAKEKNLETIFKERTPLYKKYAEAVIPVPDPFDPSRAVADIIRELSRH